jgi:hypothetical protein
MQSRQMAHPTVIHMLALIILCTRGYGFTLFEALNSNGYVRRNFSGFQILFMIHSLSTHRKRVARNKNKQEGYIP